jgi:hypothetical protein
MQCTAHATEPETTGRQFAERLRVCWPVIACHPWVDHGPDATGRIPQRPRAGCHGAYSERTPRCGKLHQGIAAPLSGRKRTRRAGQLQAPGHAEPGTIRPVTAPLTRPVVAASWHPATRQHYRGEFGTATPSAPLPAAKSGQIVAGIRPVIAASWRRDYVAQSGHQRVSAPRSQRVGAPLSGSEIGASAPSAELATKSDTIRPAIRQRNCGRSGKYPPRYRASNSGQLAASIRPVVSPAYSGQIAGHHPPRGLAAFFWEVSAPKSGGEIGEPGETTIRPAIAVAKAPQCPQSVDAPLSPVNSGKPAATIRPVTGVTGAPLPHQRPQFRSHSGRLHPH